MSFILHVHTRTMSSSYRVRSKVVECMCFKMVHTFLLCSLVSASWADRQILSLEVARTSRSEKWVPGQASVGRSFHH